MPVKLANSTDFVSRSVNNATRLRIGRTSLFVMLANSDITNTVWILRLQPFPTTTGTAQNASLAPASTALRKVAYTHCGIFKKKRTTLKSTTSLPECLSIPSLTRGRKRPRMMSSVSSGGWLRALRKQSRSSMEQTYIQRRMAVGSLAWKRTPSTLTLRIRGTSMSSLSTKNHYSDTSKPTYPA